ncbi:MAG: allantoate amidohydrolase [Corynebacterium variabile]|uniref:allantoate amidohydrolase n=1 Tax=Corynebacterium variabile TaxID=1727 RepID=UPI0026492BEB|nr:allantoate amidohydrolase [Corynebacterium variabile]MDN6535860.1 allantoate amidohydrolase [Corynebacterium variabile]
MLIDVPDTALTTFRAMWAELDRIGVHPTGTRRYSWTAEDAALRRWFTAQASARGMEVHTDANGNIRAWWGGRPADGDAGVVTGSHLDSVADGGKWDGPLGVLLGFLAVDALAAAEARGEFVRARPVGVVDYMDEEGTRFGVACLGSKLMSGVLDPEKARALTDADGVSLAEAMRAAGADPDRIGRDDAEITRSGAQVEVHIEQGKQLVGLEAPVGVASAIWPHGRWSFTFDGVADHAGTARLVDRKDAALPFASTVLAARAVAEELDARATFGRFHVEPGGPNVVPARVVALLDARAATDEVLVELVDRIASAAREAGEGHGVKVTVAKISHAPVVEFDEELRDLHGKLAAEAGEYLPEVPTQAGHDSGILAPVMPTSMLFVRSPHGISHSPLEDAADDDVIAGLRALTRSLAALAGDD